MVDQRVFMHCHCHLLIQLARCGSVGAGIEVRAENVERWMYGRIITGSAQRSSLYLSLSL